MKRLLGLSAILTLAVVLSQAAAPALADDLPSVTLTIKDHLFAPAELTIPANTKVVIVVKNLDPTPEEFESTEFHREKVVTGGSEIEVYVGPLPAGTYEFFADFHPTSRGHLIVK
jgi:plastocyanin